MDAEVCNVILGRFDSPTLTAETLDCSVDVALKPSFAVDCCHTPGPSGGNGLAIDVILHIAAGENAFDVSERSVMSDEVAVFVGCELTSEEIGVRSMTNCHEDARDGKRTFLAAYRVGKRDTLDHLITLDGSHG